MKIRTAAAELFHGDGQAGRPDESNSRASQFSNGPKKERLAWRPYLSARDVVSATNIYLFFFIFLLDSHGSRRWNSLQKVVGPAWVS